jgi:hypothetical protein
VFSSQVFRDNDRSYVISGGGGSAPHGTRVGVLVGIELATPWFHVVHRRASHGVGLCLAARAAVDGSFVAEEGVGWTNDVVSTVFGPRARLELSRHFALSARVAAGFSAIFPGDSTVVTSYAPTLDADVGVAFSF